MQVMEVIEVVDVWELGVCVVEVVRRVNLYKDFQIYEWSRLLRM